MEQNFEEEEKEIKFLYNTNNEYNVSERITFKPRSDKGIESVGGIIYRDGKKYAETDINPLASYEDSGYFMVFTGDKKAYRYCNGEGRMTTRIFGRHSGPFYNGFARVEIIDEGVKIDPARIRAGRSHFSFARINKKGKFQLMRQRFSLATFMDDCGLGCVVLAGEKKFSYVTKKGHVLPYRFIKADDCFRNGLAHVTLPGGRKAYIRSNYDIVDIAENNLIIVLTTLEQFYATGKYFHDKENEIANESFVDVEEYPTTEEPQEEKEFENKGVMDYYSELFNEQDA